MCHSPQLIAAAFVCVCVSAMTATVSDVFEETFEQGNAAYSKGRYHEAIAAYEQLVEARVVDPAVFYNLGNAYYRAGKIGPAIANYERALRWNPGMENARKNLEVSVQKTERRLPRPAPADWERVALFWHHSLSPGTMRSIAFVSWVVLWLLLAVRLFRRSVYLTRLAAVAGLIAAAFGVSVWIENNGPMYAVAEEPRVPVRYGTNDDESVRFELYEGDRVLIDGIRRNWVRVVTADGHRGWAKRDAFYFTGPPYSNADARRQTAAG